MGQRFAFLKSQNGAIADSKGRKGRQVVIINCLVNSPIRPMDERQFGQGGCEVLDKLMDHSIRCLVAGRDVNFIEWRSPRIFTPRDIKGPNVAEAKVGQMREMR